MATRRSTPPSYSFLAGLGQRRLDGGEHHVALDVLSREIAFDQHQQFAIHATSPLQCS